MDIESRIRRLEWTNRSLIFLLSIALILWMTAGHVSAGSSAKRIVADAVETRSLSVVNPTGKQGVKIAVGDSGMVSIEMTDVNGREALGLLSVSSGEPSLCLAYQGKCRVVIGDVYRGTQHEFSVQLRDKAGNSVWMPETANPAEAPGQSKPRE